MSTTEGLGTRWRTSSYTNGNGGACVEVADGFPGITPVRDSKAPEGPAVVFTTASWSAFVDAIASGRLR